MVAEIHILAWQRVGGDILLVLPFLLCPIVLVESGTNRNNSEGVMGAAGIILFAICNLISAGVIR